MTLENALILPEADNFTRKNQITSSNKNIIVKANQSKGNT